MAPKDLAQFLRVSPTTLRRMAQAGMLPAGIPVGGSVRYMPEEVINYLRQRKPRK
jgi:predicted site-specific integrase-resolvase